MSSVVVCELRSGIAGRMIAKNGRKFRHIFRAFKESFKTRNVNTSIL